MSVTLWVRLEIGGDDADKHARHALNRQLDAGELQDPLEEAGYDLTVISATVEDPPVASDAICTYCEATGYHKDDCASPAQVAFRKHDVRATVALKCDGWCDHKGVVSHIDRKGYAYCEPCGLQRRASGVPCRKLRPSELARLQRGQWLKSY